MNLQRTFRNTKPKRVVAFLATLSLLAVSITGITRSLADENPVAAEGVTSSFSLSHVMNPDTNEKMYVVKSTFYDYYSDSQITANEAPGAINDAITSGKNTFEKFNKRLLEDKKYGDESQSPAAWPLYEGLFFSKQPSSNNGDMYFYDDANATKNFDTNFWLAANHTQTTAVSAATQGLVNSKLDANGNIIQSNASNSKSCVLPYFDATYLTSTKHTGSNLSLGEVRENVAFPFVTTEKNGAVYYSFDSAKDTVVFNYEKQLDYQGQNNRQVKDSNGQIGFFPYNSDKDSKSYGLNYGFGVKMEIPFTMTADGKVNGENMIFEFAGDDDLWVFIDGELALDVGGIHGAVNGRIDFSQFSSIVSATKNNTIAFSNPNCLVVEDKQYSSDDLSKLGINNTSGSQNGINKNVKTAFNDTLKQKLKDTKTTHTMTIFYMERGKGCSNLKINFNMPEPNQLELTNTLDYSNVGSAFVSETGKVATKDVFVYDVTDKDSNLIDTAEVTGGESIMYQDKFSKGDTLMVEQVNLKEKSRKIKQLYKTGWLLSDKRGSISSSANRSATIVSDGRVEEKDAFLFKNKSEEDNSPNIVVNYTNVIATGNLMIQSEIGQGVSNSKLFEFNVKFANIFGGSSPEAAYNGPYSVVSADGKEVAKNAKDGIIKIKAGEKAIIKGVPTLTKFTVTQATVNGIEIDRVARLDGGQYTNDQKVATGNIAAGIDKENAYVFYNKVAGSGSVDEVVDKSPNAIDTASPVKEVEGYTGAVKNKVNPKTADGNKSITAFWIVCVIISAGFVIYTGIMLFKTEEEKIKKSVGK